MKVRYVGNFPPPYGGVTIKNSLIYETLSEKMHIKHFDKPSFLLPGIYQALNILLALLPGQTLIIGISSITGKSKLLTKILYKYNRNTMKRSLYFMMGGTEVFRISNNKDEIEWYKNYKRVYVETNSMKKCLEMVGLENVRIFPNCRKRQESQIEIIEKENGRLQCVFFSFVHPMKGIELILEAAEYLQNIDFIIYGEIDSDYEIEFRNAVERLNNVTYKGIFKECIDEVYRELRKYDVLLLPSMWKNEGVPGVLVEAKISGIPAIVSNINYNAELVSDEYDGIVLKQNSARNLIDAIEKLDKDRKYLNMLKLNSKISAEKFYMDKYEDDILSDLNMTGKK